MNITTIITIATSLGIGSIIGIYIQSKLDSAKQLSSRLNELNEEKYRTILIYMSLALSPNNLSHFIMRDDKLKQLELDKIPSYALEKLKEYYYHSVLYASDAVLQELKKFIQQPNRANYIASALAMRKHLWGNKTSISLIENI